MRLTTLAQSRNINKNKLKRQLSIFPGVMSKPGNKRNSPIIVNLTLLQLAQAKLNFSQVEQRIDTLENKLDKVLDALSELVWATFPNLQSQESSKVKSTGQEYELGIVHR